jgi:hypothetical protein
MPSKKNDVRRALEIKFKDGSVKTLELCKATSIHVDTGMLHLDELKNGAWRLTFSDGLADDFSKIESFNVIRED